MSIITDDYVFNSDTQLKASWQPEPTEVTQIQITYRNTTSRTRSFTITTGRDTVLETATVNGNTNRQGNIFTIPAGNAVYVDGSGCKVRFDVPSSHCSIVETIAADYSFEGDGRYGVLDAGSYGVRFGPTSDSNYPPQQVTLIIK